MVHDDNVPAEQNNQNDDIGLNGGDEDFEGVFPIDNLFGMNLGDVASDQEVESDIEMARRGMPKMNGLYVRGTVNNVETVFTIDTGASLTLMGKHIYDEIEDDVKPKLKPVHTKIRGVNGNCLKCDGIATFKIFLGGVELEKPVIVANITDDVLIGADILLRDEQGRADLLLNDRVMRLRGVSIPLESEGFPTDAHRVTLADNYLLPPLSEIICDVLLDTEENDLASSTYVIEPNQLLSEKYSVVMAPTLMDASTSVTGKVRMLNPFPTAVKLNQDVAVGFALPVDVITTFVEKEDEEEASNFASVRRITLSSEARTYTTGDDLGTGSPAWQDDDLNEVPEHMRDLFKTTVDGKSDQEKVIILKLFQDTQNVFSRHANDLGLTHITEHVIDTGDSPPIKQVPRRVPLAFAGEDRIALEKLKEQGVIQDSTSPWASPLVFVRKKSGEVRPCVDYRKLNSVTLKDAFPLPRTQDCLDAVAGAKVFSSLDITSAYNQIPIRECDVPKTAICTKYGLHEYVTMPFGLCNAPATFQRCMELALAGLQWTKCLIYLDDVLIFSETFVGQETRLREVLARIQEANLKLKPTKCHLFQSEVRFLGHILSEEGIQPNQENQQKILEWSSPKSVKEVQSFLGLANYYRRFFPRFADVAKPMVDLTRKGRVFKWTADCEMAFNKLKQGLTNPPVMAHPRSEGTFILDTDASGTAIGSTLSQIQDGEEKVVAYGSKTLNRSQRNYCVTDRELYAIRYFTEFYRCYLLGRSFIVRSDHQALKWLFNLKEPKHRVARWIEALSEFSFTVEYRKGSLHANADSLSRCPNPWQCPCKDVEKLRCGPCRKCQQKTEQMEGSMPETTSPYDGANIARIHEVQPDGRGQQMKQVPVIFGLLVVFLFSLGTRLSLYMVEGLQMVQHLWGSHKTKCILAGMAFLLLVGALVTVTCLGRGSVTSPGRGSEVAVRISRENLRSQEAWPLKVDHKRLEKMQKEDPALGMLFQWLVEGKRPFGERVQVVSPELRHYWLMWDSIVIQNGILYRRFHRRDGSGSYLQLLVPQVLRKEVLYQMHNSLLSGHLGTKKTKEKLLQRYYWFQVREDVNNWVRSCDVCVSVKGPVQFPKAPQGKMCSGAPLDRLCTDVLGPFPESPRGNKYILVVTDHFTRWVEIFAIPDQTAVTCASKILNEVIARYGCPLDIHSDQGRNYTSQLFLELCQMLDIRKTRTTSHNPRCNGQPEKFNHTLVRMIKAYLKGEQTDWDLNLGCLAGAYRATVNPSTGCTPNLLMMGREVRLPSEIMYTPPQKEGFVTYGAYVQDLKSCMEKAHQVARKHLASATKRQKDAYDAKVLLHVYQPGDLVWYATESTQMHITPKLRKSYLGPVLIVKRFDDLNYMIQIDSKGKRRVVNHNKLLPYNGTQKLKWAKQALKSPGQKQH